MAVDLAKLVVSLEAESSKLQKELRQANRRLSKWERDVKRKLRNVSKAFKQAFFVGAAATGVGSVAAVMGKMVSASEDAERQIKKLNALLNTTGHVSGQTAEELDKFARSLAESTLASTEGVRDAAGILLTFKSVGGETFKETLRLAQDLAAVMGGDLKSQTLQLAKALEDPVKGLTALTRSGVSFTQVEQDLIKSLVKSGRQLEAQSKILQKVRDQVGGAGEAEAKGTLAGAVDSLGQAFDEMFEKIGQTGIAKAAIKFIEGLTSAVKVLRDLIGETDQEKFSEAFDKRQALLNDIQRARKRGASEGDLAPLQREADALKKTLLDLQKKQSDRIKQEGVARDALAQSRILAAETVGKVEDKIIKKLEKQKTSFQELVEDARNSINAKETNPLIKGTLVEALRSLSQAKTFESAGDTKGQFEAAEKTVKLLTELREAGKVSKQFANQLLDQAAQLGGDAANRILDLKLDDETLKAEAERARILIQDNFKAHPIEAQIQWSDPNKANLDPLALGATAQGATLVLSFNDKEYATTIPAEDVEKLRGPLTKETMKWGGRC